MEKTGNEVKKLEGREVGATLRAARKAMGLTLRQVEEAAGISNPYLSQLENAKIKRPSANVLYKLSSLYKIRLEDLLESSGIISKGERVSNQLDKHEEKQLEEYLKILHPSPAPQSIEPQKTGNEVECAECYGTGRSVSGGLVFDEPCPACKGVGMVIEQVQTGNEVEISEDERLVNICDWLLTQRHGVSSSDPRSPFYYVARLTYAKLIDKYTQSALSIAESRNKRLFELLEEGFREHNHSLCKFFEQDCNCEAAWQQYKHDNGI